MTQNKQIVLIDDEPGVILALKLMLQLKGFAVSEFIDSEIALNYIQENSPKGSIDYILCDLRMPKKTGLDILVETRASCGSIPFFLMSGHAEQFEQQQALKLGAAAFLSKPFDLEAFLELTIGSNP